MLSCLAHPFIAIILAPITQREIVSLLRGSSTPEPHPNAPNALILVTRKIIRLPKFIEENNVQVIILLPSSLGTD